MMPNRENEPGESQKSESFPFKNKRCKYILSLFLIIIVLTDHCIGIIVRDIDEQSGAFSVHDGWSALIVFLLFDPHFLESGQ